MLNTLIKSNNQSIEAVQNVYESMLQAVENNKSQGRGFMYFEFGEETLWFISLEDFQKTDGASLINIDEPQYSELLDLLRDGYDFDSQFVYVVRQETNNNITFSVNVANIDPDGWKFFRDPEDIRRQEAEQQKAIAKLRLNMMKRQRKGKKR
jgi:hypothetical protein